MSKPVRHWIIQRTDDLGDVCMALCACKALKMADPSCSIWFATSPSNLPMAAACPHIDEFFVSGNYVRITEAMHEASCRNPDYAFRLLDHVRFGLDPLNQVEAYLANLKQPLCEANCKSLDLTLPPPAPGSVLDALPPCPTGKRRVVFHAAHNDPNRTWPKQAWEALGRRVLFEGHQLILIGEGGINLKEKAFRLDLPGAINLQGRFDPLGVVALLRRCDLFVSSDSGPIQLAGASDIAICGIYTVTAGRCRIPFRHGQPLWGASPIEPECPHRACFRFMSAPEHVKHFQQVLKEGGTAINNLVSTWCLEADDPYHCLRDITPDRVWEAMTPWLQVTPMEREAALKQVETIAASGQPQRALDLLETLPEVSSDAATLMLRARLLQGLGRVNESFEFLRQWLPLWPLHGGAVNLMGLASLRAGDSEAARKFFNKAKDLPDSGHAVPRNLAFLDALQALEANSLDQTMSALDEITGMPPSPDTVGEDEIAVLRLTVMLLRGHLEDGLRFADQALRQEMENADLHFLKGEILLRLDAPAEARSSFETCLSLSPAHALATERLKELTA